MRHVLTIKTGAPFSEVAPMLYDVAGLPSWERVFRGLTRLYLGEVLGKFPVVQHFIFGSLIPADWAAGNARNNSPLPSRDDGNNANANANAAEPGVGGGPGMVNLSPKPNPKPSPKSKR
mmetsp:Transcript_14260/g.42717  ORF Transcript_14260/g.42717 Transcript_14260/m.42717 type:complete len:119 (-) Transcript_14260:265-621(-)